MKHLRLTLILILASTAGLAEDKPKPFVAPTKIVFQSGTILHNVSVIRWEKDRVIVKHRGGIGPVFFRYIKQPDTETLSKWRAETEQAIKAQEEQNQLELDARRKLAEMEAARKEREDRIPNAIRERKVVVGMTPDQVIESWGRPQRINSSGGAYGTREQWVYGDTYLYFVDGILTSWQFQK